jgi:septum formation protein
MSPRTIVLASASPARSKILSQLGLMFEVIPSNIDEDMYKGERPSKYAHRIALEKANAVLDLIQRENVYVIAADTVAVLGLRVLPKATSDEIVKQCMQQISGKRHRVYTGLCVLLRNNGVLTAQRSGIVKSTVKLKRMTPYDIEWYIKSGEGINKAGGYAIQGAIQSFVTFTSGSISNIMGLPMLEIRNMLISLGYNF